MADTDPRLVGSLRRRQSQSFGTSSEFQVEPNREGLPAVDDEMNHNGIHPVAASGDPLT